MGIFRTLMFIVNHPLNHRAPIGALIRYMRWQLGSRLLAAPVAIPFGTQSVLLVRTGMTGATQSIYCGLQEFEDMAFLLHFIRQNDVFVDVGSNVGVYTILAAENGAKCNAFEPVPATFAALQQNVRVNDFQFVPELYNVAVGASSGEILFSSGLDAMNHALADGENTEKAIRVPVMPLDSYSLQPTMMKIDVEGFETEVLTGGAKTFNEHSLIAVLMELNGAGSRYGHSDKTLEETMANAGFTPFSYDPFSRRLAPIHSSRGKGNVLFIRNKEMVDERITSAPLRKINGIEF